MSRTADDATLNAAGAGPAGRYVVGPGGVVGSADVYGAWERGAFGDVSWVDAVARTDAAPPLPVPTGNQSDSGPTENAAADTAPNLLDIWEEADAWWWPEVVERLKQKALSFLGGDYYGQPGVVEEGRDRLDGFDNFLLDLDRTITESLADPDVKEGALDMLVDAYLDGAEMAYRDAGPGGGKDQTQEFINRLVTNIFCPTGKGGGIDPTCKAGTAGAEGSIVAKVSFTADNDVDPQISQFVHETLKSELSRVTTTYPIIGKILSRDPIAAVHVSGDDALREDPRVGGTYQFGQDRVIMSASNSGDLGDTAALGGWAVGGSEMVTTFRHEVGHHLAGYMTQKESQPWVDALNSIKGRTQDVSGKVSEYAKSHTGELFAETFAAYTSSGYRRGSLPPELEEAMDRMFGRTAATTTNAAREFVYGLVGNADPTPDAPHTANATPPRDAWGQFMSAKAKEMSDRLAAGWKVQAGAVSQGIANVVTKGIAAGKTDEQISADIRDFSAGVPKARADVIARTEVTRAAAEGQLDAYGRLGVSELTADTSFELRTQGKNSCPDCVALEKLGPMPVEKARGLIPVHPNCKCRWRVVRSLAGVRNDFSNLAELAVNIFCPTGKGGGIDPTCKKGERGGNLGERLHSQREALHDARVALAEAKKETGQAAHTVAREKAFLAEEQAKLPQIEAALARSPDTRSYNTRRAQIVRERIEDTQKSLQRSEARLKKAQANERQQAARVAKIEREAEAKLRHLDNPKLKKANEYTTGDVKRLLEQYKDRDSSPKFISVDAADRVAYAITKTAVPVPGGVQRHGMSQREDMVEVSINGTKIRYPKEPPDYGENVVRHLIKTLGMDGTNSPMPDKLVKATNEIVYTTQRNSADGHWEKTYGIAGFTSAATGGDGKIVVYNSDMVLAPRRFAHESGHNLASQTYGTTAPSDTSRYGQAQRKEAPVSEYGSKSPAEDFAEAAAMYVQKPATMQQQFPEKFNAMHELLGD